ncbi:MAG: dephospho-CoA kinase [Thermoprotei archaeon]|nr:MAG: dephospho-CoA kinase [Thermoprotei archaeon]
MPGSGKSLVAEAARELGLKVVSMGDAVRHEAVKRGLPVDGSTLGWLMLRLREERGATAVAELCLEGLELGEGAVVFEGVRSMAEVEAFKRRLGRAVVIAVHAPPRARFNRLRRRGRSDDPSTLREFKERDSRELKVGLGELIALADHVLVNDSTVEAAKRRARALLIKALKRGLGWAGSR